MKINRIENINFNGIYRIQNTPKNIEEIKKYVEPMYNYLKHEPIFQFSGKNPFRAGLDFVMNFIANSQNGNVDWLKMNAEIYGADFKNLGDENLFVVAGEKSIKKLFEYIVERASKMQGNNSAIERLKAFFSKPKENYSDKPEHLRPLFRALEMNTEEDEEFLKVYSAEIVEVKNTQELITKMLCER